MKTIQNLWDYLNGKKTAIGAALVTAAFLLPIVEQELIVGIWELATPLWFGKVVKTLAWVGTALVGTGFAHKLKKQQP